MAYSTAELIAREFGIPRTNPVATTTGVTPYPPPQTIGAVPLTNLQVPLPPPVAPPAQPSYALQGAPVAPQAPTWQQPTTTSSSSGLASQLLGQQFVPQTGATKTSLADQFATSGLQFPREFPTSGPDADAYMKSRLASIPNPATGLVNASYSDLARVQAVQGGRSYEDLHGTPAGTVPSGYLAGGQAPGTGTVGAGQPPPGVSPELLQLLQGQLGGGLPGLPGGPGGQGQPQPMGALEQQLMQRLQGQGTPQVDPNQQAFQIDPQLLQLLRQQATGQDPNMPSFQDVVSGQYEPVAAQLDKIFNTSQSALFEDLIGRGVLQSGESVSRLTELSDQLGISKSAAFGQMAMEYAQMRQESIKSAISQWGILEGNRASNAVTINGDNLEAAVSTQNTAMQTLTNLNTAMAQITSGERIAGAEIGSRERVAGQQIGSNERIAGMDISSRQAIAEMQGETQRYVANIGAQAMLQANQMDVDQASAEWAGKMALEGVDWDRFNSDPAYRQDIVMKMGIRQDGFFAIAQAVAADNIIGSLEP